MPVHLYITPYAFLGSTVFSVSAIRMQGGNGMDELTWNIV